MMNHLIKNYEIGENYFINLEINIESILITVENIKKI